jgi:hypothetical protein
MQQRMEEQRFTCVALDLVASSESKTTTRTYLGYASFSRLQASTRGQVIGNAWRQQEQESLSPESNTSSFSFALLLISAKAFMLSCTKQLK